MKKIKHRMKRRRHNIKYSTWTETYRFQPKIRKFRGTRTWTYLKMTPKEKWRKVWEKSVQFVVD